MNKSMTEINMEIYDELIKDTTGKVYKRFDKVVENSRKAVVSNISLSQEKLMRRLKKRKLL